jgi:hypothetical protein
MINPSFTLSHNVHILIKQSSLSAKHKHIITESSVQHIYCHGGTWLRSWLRHYATSRKVAGSITDEVDFLNWPNASSRIIPQGSTQPLTEMSTRNLPGGKGRPALKIDNLTAICELIVGEMWKLRLLTTLWASRACYKDSFTFIYWHVY